MFIKRKIQFLILDYLKDKGKASNKELYEIVKRVYDIAYQQFLSILMELEVEGFVELHHSKDSGIVILKQLKKTS